MKRAHKICACGLIFLWGADSAFFQETDALNMIGLWEDIEGCDFLELVASLDETFGIAGQGGRIARNIGQSLGLQRQDSVQGLARQP